MEELPVETPSRIFIGKLREIPVALIEDFPVALVKKSPEELLEKFPLQLLEKFLYNFKRNSQIISKNSWKNSEKLPDKSTDEVSVETSKGILNGTPREIAGTSPTGITRENFRGIPGVTLI